MNSIRVTISDSRDFLLTVLFFQFTFVAATIFDVPVVRQVIGFLYLTFVPGFVMVKLFKFEKIDGVQTVLISVGLSVAFLMFAGLLISEFSLVFGFPEPLSLFPLMIILNSFILIGLLLACLRDNRINFWNAKTPRKFLSLLLFTALPALSIVGTLWVNTVRNNVILLFMIVAIALFVVAGITLKKLLSPRLYPLAIIMIAISLLLHCSLISNYTVLFGSDVSIEYFVFKTTEKNAYWDSTNTFFGNKQYQRINSMLSVTILPTVYSNLLNMEPTWVLKLLFPLIFSFVPLVLYQVWQTYVGRKYAFIATFLFMAEATFYTEMLGLNRQMIAELFFVLLLFVVLNQKMKPLNKMICFMIFSVALVTSHYALAEIFLFFISLTLVSFVVLKWSSRNITAVMVVFFFVVMFSWYIYTSNSATFDSFLSFGDDVYGQLGEFFNPGSRGETVLRGLGLEEPPSFWNVIGRLFAYLTQAFIIIGFVGLVTKRIKIRGKEYFILNVMAVVFLVLLISVPGLANTLNMTRFYHLLLFFLAPLCVMGGLVLVNSFCKREVEVKVSILLLIFLVPYFLFQTSFVYEVTGSDSWSLPLSLHRMDGYRLYRQIGYVYSQDVFSAQWMSKNVDLQNTQVYADTPSRLNILIVHGMMYGGNINRLSNTSIVSANATVYLSWLNVVEGIIVSKKYAWNTSEFLFIFDGMNKVYSNGASEIYKNSTT